jgi:transcriptional regulator with XRE-family HTH domain
MTDYRDQLEDLFKSLRDREGLTRYRISQKAGLSEQRISNLLKKKTNLSVPSLESMLTNLGYRIEFEPAESASTGDAPKEDKRVIAGR